MANPVAGRIDPKNTPSVSQEAQEGEMNLGLEFVEETIVIVEPGGWGELHGVKVGDKLWG